MKGKLKNIILWSITAIIAITASVYGISNLVNVSAEEQIDGKELFDNHDGTYRLELSAIGDADPITETVANVNVLIVYDRSSSMTSNRVTTNGPRRADAAESVVYHFVDDLFGYKQGENGENIQVALVEFAVNASTTQTWTNDPTLIIGTEANPKFSTTGAYNSARRNYSNNANGTNWQAALEEAIDVLDDADGDPTFVIFITDGAPTARGNGGNAINPSGQSSWTAFRPYYEAARSASRGIQTYKTGESTEDNTTLFGIYAYGREADLLDDLIYYSNVNADRPNYNGDTLVDDNNKDNYFSAGDTEALKTAVKKIFKEIVNAMGVSNVTINDGTTSNVTTSTGEISHLLTVDTSSFKYWLTVPVVNDQFTRIDFDTNTEITYTVSDIGNGKLRITWGENGENHVDVTGELSNNSFKYQWVGADDLYNYAPPTATYENGAVNWNLGTKIGTLLDGVKYTVSFDVWPSQETYDLISDLDNGIRTYSSLDSEIKKYIEPDGNGGYTLRTNTQAKLTYTDTRVSNTPQTSYYKNPEPVATDVSKMTVKKLWENSLDTHHNEVTEVKLNVLKDGVKYGETIVLDNKTVDPVTGDAKEKWENEVFISTGLMSLVRDTNGNITSAKIRENGHNYTFEEIEDGHYYWDLDVETVRPMVVNEIVDGEETPVLKTFVKVKDNAPAIGDSNVAIVDGVTYFKINGEVYYMRDGNQALMNATNIRRSHLNITKKVTGEAPEDATFTFTLKVNDFLGNAVWFSIRDKNNNVVKNANVSANNLGMENGTDGTFNGYYYVPSGTEITVDLKADWNLRFTNLATGSTYTFTETTMPNNFALAKVDATKVMVPVELLPVDATDNGDGTYTSNSTGLTYTKVSSENEVYYTYVGEAKTTGQKTEGTIFVGSTIYDVVYTNDYQKTHISGVKKWVDDDNQDGLRPDYITLKLNALVDGTPVEEIEEEKEIRPENATDDVWNFSFDDLDRYYNGKEVSYSISELAVSGYKVDIQKDKNGDYVITNTHESEKIDIKGVKGWADANDLEGYRPQSITVNLVAKLGETVLSDLADTKSVSPNENGDWVFTFSNLPKCRDGEEINYSVTEVAVDGYDAPVYDYDETSDYPYIIINTRAPKNLDITVKKEWDEVSVDGITNPFTHAYNIDVRLVGMVGEKTYFDETKTVVLDENGDWTYTFTDLPEFRDAKNVEYTAYEATDMKDYSVTSDMVKVDTLSEDETVKNDHYLYTLTNKYNPGGKVDINGEKIWNDGLDQDGIRPTSITVNLIAKQGDTVLSELADSATVVPDKDDKWFYEFTNLPKNHNGEQITYTLEEVSVDGYTTTMSNYNITNTHTPEVVSFSISKIWKDNNNNDGLRPDKITVRLFANDVEVASREANEANNWSCEFIGFDKYNKGNLINYKIVEDEVKAYSSQVKPISTVGNNSTYEIINSHEDETVDIIINKTWDDYDDISNIRPSEILVDILQDGNYYKTVSITLEDNWLKTFGLPKWHNGILYKYDIIEHKIAEYDAKYIKNGYKFDIINHHELGIGGGPEEEPPQTGIAYDEYSVYKYIYIILMLCGILGIRIRFEKSL